MADRKILIAFVLNVLFSAIEFIGGIVTGSVAIISDSIHDLGDALSIGMAYYLEKLSRKQPDNKYTYGYMRYSVLGSVLTTIILIVGSVLIIWNSVDRIYHPVIINYDGMMAFAVIGMLINLGAAFVTHGGSSLNQKAINLHMLEDVLGWVVVLVGAVVMKLTNISIIDPLMSIGVALFILINATRMLIQAIDLFMEKVPDEIDTEEIKEHLMNIHGVDDVHHLHIWSLDGQRNYATVHVATVYDDYREVKQMVKKEMAKHGITHVTIEIELDDEVCTDKLCKIKHIHSDVGHSHVGHRHSHVGHSHSHMGHNHHH